MIPGQVFVADGDIELNVGRKTLRLAVDNTGDRPVQVGSHYHFYETNPALAFDRPAAYGFRLDIAAGTAVRFEPGQRRTVDLVALDGRRTVFGLRAAVSGKLKSAAPATLPPGPGEARAGAGRPVKAAKPSKASKPAPSTPVAPRSTVTRTATRTAKGR